MKVITMQVAVADNNVETAKEQLIDASIGKCKRHMLDLQVREPLDVEIDGLGDLVDAIEAL